MDFLLHIMAIAEKVKKKLFFALMARQGRTPFIQFVSLSIPNSMWFITVRKAFIPVNIPAANNPAL
jgi:hypothetical protein